MPRVLDGLAPGTATATVALGPLAAFDVPGPPDRARGLSLGLHRADRQPGDAAPLLRRRPPKALGIARRRARSSARLDEAIRGVLANQNGAGGFGLWNAEASGDGWLDAYVTDFLSRARAQGHAVPDRAFQSALGNLANLVNAYGDFEKGGEDLAYALMVLAREGRAAIGDLRYYADTRADAFATPLAQAQLGAALALAGDQPRADAMFRRAGLAARGGRAGAALPHRLRQRPARRRRRPRARRRGRQRRGRPRGADRHRHRARGRALDPGAALDAAGRPCARRRRRPRRDPRERRPRARPGAAPRARRPAAARDEHRHRADARRRHRLRRADPAGAGAGQRLPHRAPAPDPRRRAGRSRRHRAERPAGGGGDRDARARPRRRG